MKTLPDKPNRIKHEKEESSVSAEKSRRGDLLTPPTPVQRLALRQWSF